MNLGISRFLATLTTPRETPCCNKADPCAAPLFPGGPHTPAERELHYLDLLSRQAADVLTRVQSEESLRQAARKKDEFLATLAHELRNPLAPIRSGLELLKEAQDPGTLNKV